MSYYWPAYTQSRRARLEMLCYDSLKSQDLEIVRAIFDFFWWKNNPSQTVPTA